MITFTLRSSPVNDHLFFVRALLLTTNVCGELGTSPVHRITSSHSLKTPFLPQGLDSVKK